MKMNDVEKKIENLKAEFLKKLEELQKEAEMQKEQEECKPWKPKDGEGYFHIGIDFTIDCWENDNDNIDERNFKIGNCFPTKKRAEEVVEKIRLLLRLEQLHDMLCPDYVPDFGSGEATYCLYYDYSSSRWAVEGWYDCNCRVNGPYFDTEENAEKAAEILNKELTSRRFTKIRLKTKEK